MVNDEEMRFGFYDLQTNQRLLNFKPKVLARTSFFSLIRRNLIDGGHKINPKLVK